MHDSYYIAVDTWSAWLSGLAKLSELKSWAAGEQNLPLEYKCPKALCIPAMQRRRCSKLAKTSLEIAEACTLNSDVSSIQSVFASRHGESDINLSLLNSVAQRELLSPMEFTLSVHNAVSGLFTISNQNRLPSSAVAARTHILSAGMFEALSYLGENPDLPLLLIISDYPVPEEFCHTKEEQGVAYALGMLLRIVGAPSTKSANIFKVTPGKAENSSRRSESPEVLTFVNWFLSESVGISFLTRKSQLKFEKCTDSWENNFRAIQSCN